jgi:hypothetical protein
VAVQHLSAQPSQAPDAAYTEAMETSLMKLDSAKQVADYEACRNLFESIANKYTNQWMPAYYVAYTNIRMVFKNSKHTDADAMLADADRYIEQAKALANADQSEIYTLRGYYFNACILLNAAANGPKYLGEVQQSYQKAIAENANNPRPVFLLAMFDSYLPLFLRSVKEPCEEYRKALTLYQNSDAKTLEKPYWGKAWLAMLAGKCK